MEEGTIKECGCIEYPDGEVIWCMVHRMVYKAKAREEAERKGE